MISYSMSLEDDFPQGTGPLSFFLDSPFVVGGDKWLRHADETKNLPPRGVGSSLMSVLKYACMRCICSRDPWWLFSRREHAHENWKKRVRTNRHA